MKNLSINLESALALVNEASAKRFHYLMIGDRILHDRFLKESIAYSALLTSLTSLSEKELTELYNFKF